jgi:hypothetical protein
LTIAPKQLQTLNLKPQTVLLTTNDPIIYMAVRHEKAVPIR